MAGVVVIEAWVDDHAKWILDKDVHVINPPAWRTYQWGRDTEAAATSGQHIMKRLNMRPRGLLLLVSELTRRYFQVGMKSVAWQALAFI